MLRLRISCIITTIWNKQFLRKQNAGILPAFFNFLFYPFWQNNLPFVPLCFDIVWQDPPIPPDNSFSRASGFPLFHRGTWCIAHKIMLHASLHRHVFCTCPIQSTPEHTPPLPGSLHISLLSSSNNQHNILHRLELQKINFALFHFSSFIFVLKKQAVITMTAFNYCFLKICIARYYNAYPQK